MWLQAQEVPVALRWVPAEGAAQAEGVAGWEDCGPAWLSMAALCLTSLMHLEIRRFQPRLERSSLTLRCL